MHISCLLLPEEFVYVNSSGTDFAGSFLLWRHIPAFGCWQFSYYSFGKEYNFSHTSTFFQKHLPIYMDLSIRVIMCIYFLVYICPFFTRLLHFFKANTVSFNRNTNCFTCHQKINKPNWHNHIKNNRTWLNSCIRITLQEHVHPDKTSKQLILTPGAHSVGKL